MFNVHIKNNQTQEVAIYDETYLTKDGKFNYYIWQDGNYSCDCNRHLFFHRVLGTSYNDMPDFECGDEKYSITVYDEAGNLILEE